MQDVYIKPWCRIGPYVVGFFAGYILYKTDCRIRIPKVIHIIFVLVLRPELFLKRDSKQCKKKDFEHPLGTAFTVHNMSAKEHIG